MKAYIDRILEFMENLFVSAKSLLSVDPGWKLFSFIVAIITWFIVINATNPLETWTYPCKLTLDGIEDLKQNNGVVVQNQKHLENTSINVKIRGNRLNLETLNRFKNDIVATANLGVIYDFSLNKEVLAPIDVKFPVISGIKSDAFEVVAKNPDYAKVMLEKIEEVTKPVKVSLIGEVKEGYVALQPTCVPETVLLNGSTSKLKEVSAVLVENELKGEISDIRINAPPQIVDKDGNNVEGVTCSAQTIDVFIQVEKYSKIPVVAEYAGQPASGYAVTDISLNPEFLELVGDEEAIASITKLTLPPINVAGLTQTSTTTYDVRQFNILPTDVSIKNGTPNSVAVTATIDKDDRKTVFIPKGIISFIGTMDDEYSYDIVDTKVSVVLSGRSASFSKVTAVDLQPSINIDTLPVGSSKVDLNIVLPEGVTLIGDKPSITVAKTVNNSKKNN